MSYAARLDNLESELANDLSNEFGTQKVIPLNRVEKITVDDIEAAKEGVAKTLRRGIAKYEQLKADIRRDSKATVASLEAEKKALKARYDADLAALTERITETKAKAAEDIAHADGIVSMSKAALKAAPAE